MQVQDVLQAARQMGVDRLDAQWLLGHHLQRPRAWLLAHEDESLPPALEAVVLDQLARRAAGVPLAYLTGEREFCGLVLQVSPDVLIPRPETEMLVDWALSVLPEESTAEVADLGTGSGAIALTLAACRPGLRVTATDASAAALTVAAANARRLGIGIGTALGPWWAPLAGRRFGLAVSNPPYVAEGDPHLPALAHEPRSALTAGADGLDDLRAIVAGAGAHLAAGAWLLLEHGHDQGQAVQALLAAGGFEALQTRHDLAGLARCTGGRRPLI